MTRTADSTCPACGAAISGSRLVALRQATITNLAPILNTDSYLEPQRRLRLTPCRAGHGSVGHGARPSLGCSPPPSFAWHRQRTLYTETYTRLRTKLRSNTARARRMQGPRPSSSHGFPVPAGSIGVLKGLPETDASQPSSTPLRWFRLLSVRSQFDWRRRARRSRASS